MNAVIGEVPTMIPDLCLSRLSEWIAEAMGLHFPPKRWPELRRGIAQAAAGLGFEDPTKCAERLLSQAPDQATLEELARHLTVGETYFFRDPKIFEILTGTILPKLIESRRRSGLRRLRFWSAGCCTGEEPYSLAIALRQILPDAADWNVSIIGTDLNKTFIRKGVEGSYGEWSFRDVSPGFKERYFVKNRDGRYTVKPEFRKWVNFTPLNLAGEELPPAASEGFDLIFCRNVLMYFTPSQARKVVGKLHRSLNDGGYLVVSPSETSQSLFFRFAIRNFPGVILYQKAEVPRLRPPAPVVIPPPDAHFEPPVAAEIPQAPVRPTAPVPEKPADPFAAALSLYHLGHYAEAAGKLTRLIAERRHDPQVVSLLARALANQGELAEALTWCERWIAIDKLDAAGHYLRATILLEHGREELARRSLRRAIYLQPDFALAHFAFGTLAKKMGQRDEAEKHFANTVRLLRRMAPDDLLDESGGLTAGRLIETINALTLPR